MQKFLFLIIMLAALPSYAADSVTLDSVALDTITLQLKWTHAFQFAGYYAAKEQGYYREAGLDVRIEEALPGVEPVKNVLEGKAQFGVGTSALLLERKAGSPVVVLAVIFQHSPYVLISRQFNSIQTIHDLIGKRVMLEPQADELLAYLMKENIPLASITQIPHSFNPQDLIDGKIDAIAGYITNQPYYLNRSKFRYQIHTPRSAGIDFYGDNLFTTEYEIRNHPERVKAFREASLKGWNYAVKHPEEMADMILARYSQRHTRDYFLFEAKQTINLIHPELIEIGHINPGRWQNIADTYADIGMLPGNFSLNGFLYDPNPRLDLTWLYRLLAATLLLSIIGAVIFVIMMNRNLAKKVATAQHELAQNFEMSHKLKLEHAATVERERIYRDLHDDVGAKLLSLVIFAQRGNLTREADMARSALQDLRDVVSRSAQVSTPLCDLLADLRANKEQRVQAAGLSMEWRLPTEGYDVEVSADAALNLSRILREAVTNILRHAHASHIEITTRLTEDRMILEVTDNGAGCQISVARPHRGMISMQARARALGGMLSWEPVEPNGCKVVLDVPISGLWARK